MTIRRFQSQPVLVNMLQVRSATRFATTQNAATLFVTIATVGALFEWVPHLTMANNYECLQLLKCSHSNGPRSRGSDESVVVIH